MVMLVMCGQEVEAMLEIWGMWLLRMDIISMRLEEGVPRESQGGGRMVSAVVVVEREARRRSDGCIVRAAVRLVGCFFFWWFSFFSLILFS